MAADAQTKPRGDLPAQQRTLAALAKLQTVPLSAEEEEILHGFEAFRREHPTRFASLTEEEDR